jgi:hypothetical protein
MLPYFRTAGEVEAFVQLVKGRAWVIILIETGAAVVRIREILAVPGIDEVMLGLNDLRLELAVQSHFEVLASPLVDLLAHEVHRADLPLAIGGLASPTDPSLAIPPDLVFAQYPRLGATGAWVSRSFFVSVLSDQDFRCSIALIRQRLTAWSLAPPQALEDARRELAERARELALVRRGRHTI